MLYIDIDISLNSSEIAVCNIHINCYKAHPIIYLFWNICHRFNGGSKLDIYMHIWYCWLSRKKMELAFSMQFYMNLEQYGLRFTTKIFVPPKWGFVTLTALLTWAEQISLMPEFLFYYCFSFAGKAWCCFWSTKNIEACFISFLSRCCLCGDTDGVNLVLLWILLV